MIKPDVLQAIRILSFYEADKDTAEAWYRNICRWYSREFHTPLPQVMEMNEESVVQTYYEDLFYRFKSNAIDEEAQKKYEEFKADFLDLYSDKPEQSSGEENDDDEWYRDELAKLQKESDEKAKKNNKLEGKGDKPNLNDTQEITTFYEGESSSSEDE